MSHFLWIFMTDLYRGQEKNENFFRNLKAVWKRECCLCAYPTGASLEKQYNHLQRMGKSSAYRQQSKKQKMHTTLNNIKTMAINSRYFLMAAIFLNKKGCHFEVLIHGYIHRESLTYNQTTGFPTAFNFTFQISNNNELLEVQISD